MNTTTNNTPAIETSTRTVLKVELYNITKHGRAVGNGYMVGRYTLGGTRVATMRDFGADGVAAARYVDFWNGPSESVIVDDA